MHWELVRKIVNDCRAYEASDCYEMPWSTSQLVACVVSMADYIHSMNQIGRQLPGTTLDPPMLPDAKPGDLVAVIPLTPDKPTVDPDRPHAYEADPQNDHCCVYCGRSSKQHAKPQGNQAVEAPSDADILSSCERGSLPNSLSDKTEVSK
jgi:hypothetical protein